VTYESQKLRDASEGQVCVRCGSSDNVVGCHYTGVRRLAYCGGFGQKVHDFLTADLCQECHKFLDTLSRSKTHRWEHSEEFQHCILLTLERRFIQGIIVVKGGTIDALPKLVPRRVDMLSREALAEPAHASGTGEHLAPGGRQETPS
jgi:hypothetical protein